MKQLLTMAFAALTLSAAAQKTKTENFKVYGNCGMCESRIEKAAKIIGVTKVNWNDKTQMMTVVYDPSKTTLDKIQKSIAAVGHDTDKEKASEEAYKKLPGCCKYDRKAESTTNDNHSHH